jgi:glucans biosynthesis protein
VAATRVAALVNPGAANPRPKASRFIIDFAGGELSSLRATQPVRADVTVEGAKLLASRVEAAASAGAWRLVIDVEPEGGRTAELRARLFLRSQLLTETWSYALRPG